MVVLHELEPYDVNLLEMSLHQFVSKSTTCGIFQSISLSLVKSKIFVTINKQCKQTSHDPDDHQHWSLQKYRLSTTLNLSISHLNLLNIWKAQSFRVLRSQDEFKNEFRAKKNLKMNCLSSYRRIIISSSEKIHRFKSYSSSLGSGRFFWVPHSI